MRRRHRERAHWGELARILYSSAGFAMASPPLSPLRLLPLRHPPLVLRRGGASPGCRR